MVLGLGTDLTEISRIEKSITRFGERFLRRIFTPAEIAYCLTKKNHAESFAARFAAKEAGAKALGTGIARGVGWQDFEVLRAPSGRPTLVLHHRASRLATALGVTHTAITLTHSRDTALAVVILEGSPKQVTAATMS